MILKVFDGQLPRLCFEHSETPPSLTLKARQLPVNYRNLKTTDSVDKLTVPRISIFALGDTMARPANKIIQAKLVLVGDMGTGKTSLVLRFIKGQFFDHQEPTIGAAFFTQILSLTEATVKFDIWDTAGQERYHSLTPMYYRGASAAVVVYDISNMDTFIRAKKWIKELQDQGIPHLVMSLVANKSDLESKREVTTEDGEQLAQENGMLFIETSARTSVNINEVFSEIAKQLVTVCPQQPTGVNLGHEGQGRRLFCCSA